MRPLDCAIVPAAAADVPAIAALHAESWQTAYRGMLPDAFLDGPVYQDRLAVWNTRMSKPSPGQYVLKAVAGGELGGFACLFLHRDEEWGTLLDNLHVRPALKRSGIGGRLLQACLAHVRSAAPGERMHLWVFEANVDARSFYERNGGTIAGERTIEIVPGCRVPELRYAWDAPAPAAF